MKRFKMNAFLSTLSISIVFSGKISAFTFPLHYGSLLPDQHQHEYDLRQHRHLFALAETEITSELVAKVKGSEHEVIRVATVLTKGLEHLEDEVLEKGIVKFSAAQVANGEEENTIKEGSFGKDGLIWRGVVIILCALWASNFATSKLVLAEPGVDVSLYALGRFSLAAFSLLPGSIISVQKGNISWETARGAIACGSWVAFGYLGQLIGLMDTTPSRSCVICSLHCIFVAIVAEFLRVNSAQKRGYTSQFDLKKLIPALIAVAGVAIIEFKGAAGQPTWGDFISFSQPIGFGMGYLQLEKLMKEQPSAALPVSAIKLTVVAVVALAYFELSPHVTATLDAASLMDSDVPTNGVNHALAFTLPDFSPIISSPVALGAIFYTGFITTSLALWIESIAFQRVPATDASVILTVEPLFAAAVSALFIGETFGFSDAVGALFIVGACIYAIKVGDFKEVCDDGTLECYVDEK